MTATPNPTEGIFRKTFFSHFITVVVANENDIKDLLFAHVYLFASVKFVVTRALTCIANVSHKFFASWPRGNFLF